MLLSMALVAAFTGLKMREKRGLVSRATDCLRAIGDELASTLRRTASACMRSSKPANLRRTNPAFIARMMEATPGCWPMPIRALPAGHGTSIASPLIRTILMSFTCLMSHSTDQRMAGRQFRSFVALIHSFGSSNSDSTPSIGAVVFDSSGNLYGTTYYGGVNGVGSVYKLSPGSESWSYTLLFSFDGSNGAGPDYGALIFDTKGNLYGTTQVGGTDQDGAVYELTPAGGAWTETFLASFDGTDGLFSYGGVVFGPGGNLYGTTEYGGTHDSGVVYQIKP